MKRRNIEAYDLTKENQPSVQDELRELRGAIERQTAALEDLTALVMGLVTGEKVTKLS